MPAIRGARDELARLKADLARLDEVGPPRDVAAVRRRMQIEFDILKLERLIARYDADGERQT